MAGGMRAFVTLSVEPGEADRCRPRGLGRIPQIETLYAVSGKFDYVALVRDRRPPRTWTG
jgi:hypothetical protein